MGVVCECRDVVWFVNVGVWVCLNVGVWVWFVNVGV